MTTKPAHCDDTDLLRLNVMTVITFSNWRRDGDACRIDETGDVAVFPL